MIAFRRRSTSIPPLLRPRPDRLRVHRARRPAICLLATGVVAAAAPPLPPPVLPDQALIARAGDGVTMTAGGLRALVATLAPADRDHVAHDPAALAEMVRSAVLQSELFAQAHAHGWDRRPDVAAAAERARRDAIVRSYIARQLPASPEPSDADLHAAYEANKTRFMLPRQYHLAQIFRAVPAGATTAQAAPARQLLDGLRTHVAGQPAAFAAAAATSSQDRQSAAAGGDLGWIAETKLTPPIRAVVTGLAEGAVSEPLRTSDGWHLIALLATRPAGPAPFEQARPALLQALAQQRQQTATNALLDTMLQHNPIVLDQTRLAQFADSPGAP